MAVVIARKLSCGVRLSTLCSLSSTNPRRLSTMSEPPVPKCLKEPMIVPQRTLLGPGPSNVSQNVLDAMNNQVLGHLHPEFTKIMDDVKAGMQYVFKTNNRLTLAVSGTGHSGMEAALANLVERGDTVLVLENGIWGQRAADMVERIGGIAHKLVVPLGEAVSLKAVEQGLKDSKASVVFVCHGESSTGVLHPLEGFGDVCRKHNALLLVDTVASLGAAPFNMDELKVDCVYSATQKALSCPPGLAPISFNDRAEAKMASRTTKCCSFYMDMNMLGNYWGCYDEPRRYHHTGMVSMVYALRQALCNVAEEGINKYIQRHIDNTNLLHKKLTQIGLQPFVKDQNLRLAAITTVVVPEGVEDKAVSSYMIKELDIEIALGLGQTSGKIWRVGLMGTNSNPETVQKVVAGLQQAIAKFKSSL